jgi:hypothetical protein
MENYDLKENILLHDKYEQIEKVIKDIGIDINSSPDYSKIIINKVIHLNMNAENGRIIYSWNLSINDYLGQILILFAVVLLVNTNIISNIISKGKFEYIIVDNIPETLLNIVILIIIISVIIYIPNILGKRIKKMEEIRNILDEKNILIN